MREIYFRGKDLDGNWREGDLIWATLGQGQKPMILDAFDEIDIGNNLYEVDPDTVGQFTGLKDITGADIYEGDILEVDYPFYWPAPPLPRERVVVCYLKGKFQFHLASPHSYTDLYFAKLAKVIGNVHDNPQLMEAKDARN